MSEFKIPKKLIEVALPLDVINQAAAREKSIRHGHPSTLHLWWARRPLAAARAVIFAQMVNDPGYERHLGRGMNKAAAKAERERLFELMGRLVQWENTSNEAVLNEAREEIRKSWRETCHLNREHPRAAALFDPEKLPAFHDPFAGGGSIPLEAQRLGLEAHASDLNPVAVTINKAMIEIPPKFAGRAPVGPLPPGESAPVTVVWRGAQGLAEDVRRYGHWMREAAEKRIGHLYPTITVTAEMAAARPDLKPYVGQQLTVIAWLWARTVKSPNPAFAHVDVPLASNFVLASKEGKEAWVEPVVTGDTYRFEVRTGKPGKDALAGTTAGKRSAFLCLMSGIPIDYNYIRQEGQAGRMGQRLMAVVAEGKRGRVYLEPDEEHIAVAASAIPEWRPENLLPDNPRDFKTPNYGLTKFGDLFTPRQLVALTTFSDLVAEATARCQADAVAAGMADDEVGLDQGGLGARAYGEAVSVYLSLIVNKLSECHSSICTWSAMPKNELVVSTFRRQALPMTWDFGESNPFAESSGSMEKISPAVSRVIDTALTSSSAQGRPAAVSQVVAQEHCIGGSVVSTDPPYYDNIGYADLSDFFYVWLRRSLKPIFPSLYATMAVPKAEELVATPYRHGGKEAAEQFFMNGMGQAMTRLADESHPAFPVTIYYAFKQSETKEGATSSTGWETFLEAVIQAGFALVGTWPMRTERDARSIGIGANALASSVILVCQRRPLAAPTLARRDFIRELRAILPEALDDMTLGSKDTAPIAPVDLAQAAIGPGMAVFSRYGAIIDGSGQPMSVKTALALINKEVDAYFNHGEGDLDPETRFCLDWFAQYGWKVGEFGTADTLARAKGTSVDGVRDGGVIEAASGKVRLLKPAEYPASWDPTTDERLPIWEALHQLIRVYQAGGEREAAVLLRMLGTRQEAIRQVAYRLYTECERKGWAEDARAYNELVVGWEHIERAVERLREETPSGQLSLF